MTSPSSQPPRPGAAVTATTDGDEKALFAPEVHGRDHIGGITQRAIRRGRLSIIPL